MVCVIGNNLDVIESAFIDLHSQVLVEYTPGRWVKPKAALLVLLRSLSSCMQYGASVG